ncbi:6522_t:CDS:1, partial [Funneliformis geosporum]
SFRLFFDLVEELVQIVQIKEGSDMHILPILSILHRNKQDLIEVTCEGETMSLGKMYHLLLYLEWDISLIHGDLGIVGHTNSEISGLEAEKNARAYLQKFRRSIRSSAPKIEPKVENISSGCELLPALPVGLEEKRFRE